MTTEELLKPRYKVIADYPKSLYNVGDIINAGTTSQDCIYCDHEGPRMRHYPHLFQPLQWWEEREGGDVPEYIKSNDNRAIRPMNELTPVGFRICCIEKWLPATKEEYEASIKEKEDKQ